MAQNLALEIAAGESAGYLFALNEGPNLIGRSDPGSNVTPEIDLEPFDPDAKVSRRHATIFVSGTGVRIRDEGSMNGTHVNRKELPSGGELKLSLGDEILCGKTLLKLREG